MSDLEFDKHHDAGRPMKASLQYSLAQRTDIGASAKVVFLALYSRGTPSGNVIISLPDLAAASGLSPRTVATAVKQLREARLVTSRRRHLITDDFKVHVGQGVTEYSLI